MLETLKRLIAGKIHDQQTVKFTPGECGALMLSEKKALSIKLQCESEESNLWHDSCFFISLIVTQVEYMLWLSWLLSTHFDKIT